MRASQLNALEVRCKRVSHWIPLLVSLVVALGACDQGPAGDAFAVRDSAGLRIAESARPVWEDGEGWTVAAEPMLSIGVAEGDSTEELDRVTGALRLGGDTLVLVDGGSSQLRWYDASGRLVRAVGRAGEGPAEFSRYGPGRMCALADGRILVADPMQQRAHVFTRAGVLSDVVLLRVQAVFPSIHGCFEDGTLLGWHSVGAPERIPGRINPAEIVWTRLHGDGASLGEIARLPARPQYLLDQGDGTATYHAIPFTAMPSAGAGSDALYVTAGTSAVIERRALDGAVERIIRWTPRARIRSAEVYERYRAYVIDAQTRPEGRRNWARFFDRDVDVPEYVASVQRLLVDDVSHIWAERYRLPWDSVPTWDVFDPEGRWLGGVGVPERFEIHQIGGEFVLGVHRDGLGVERVGLHALDRRRW